MSRLLPAAFLASFVLPAAVPATAAAQGFAVRASSHGLDQLEAVVPVALPPTLTLPALERELFECPISDRAIVASAREGTADIAWRELDLSMRGDVLEVDAVLDLEAATRLVVDNAYLCLGRAVCDVNVVARPLAVTVEIGVKTLDSGKLDVNDLDIDIYIDPDGLDIDIDGCAVGEALEWIVEGTKQWVTGAVTSLVASYVEGQVTSGLEGGLGELVPLHFERDGLGVNGALMSLDVTSGVGVTVTGDARFFWQGEVDPAAPITEAPIGEPLPELFGPGEVAFAASDALVTTGLHYAWRAGLLADAVSEFVPASSLSVDLDALGLGQQLGLPDGTSVEVALDVGGAPAVEFGRKAVGDRVRASLKDLTARITIASPGHAPSEVVVGADGTLVAGVGVDPNSGALILIPEDLEVERLSVSAGTSSLLADAARLRGFLRGVAVPMLRERLASAPLAPAIAPVDGVFALVRQLETETGWLRVGVDLYAAPEGDTVAPETRLSGDRRVIPAGVARVDVDGSDADTPDGLVRYVAWLDGDKIIEEPVFGTSIEVSAKDGDHVLEVAAVDLAGNVDATPARVSLVVDGVAPELEVASGPGSVVSGGAVSASWTASDDRGVVTTGWQLRKLESRDAVGRVVDEGELLPATDSVELTGLDRGALYVLEIVARDEAGNVTSQAFGFSVAQVGGCDVGGGAGALGLLVVAVVLGLVLRRRRTGVWVVLAVGLVTPAVAQAQGVGTNLSGPTDADGAAAFWNPAAMLRGTGTRLDAGSGLSLIRVDYAPDTAASGNGAAPGGESNLFVPKPEPTIGGYTDALGKQWRLGFTIALPQIDGASWSRNDDAAQVTRYYAVNARQFHITMTPAVAYSPTRRLALGAGLNIMNARLIATVDKDFGGQLNRSLGSPDPDSPFPYADPNLAAPVEINASGWGVGAVLGGLYQPHDRVTIGASVHTPVNANSRGTVDVEYPEAMLRFVEMAAPAAELPELAGDIESELGMPLMAFAAVAVEPAPRWELRADYRYQNRSSLASTDLVVMEATSPDVTDTSIVKGYRDRHSVGLRASHRLSPKLLVAGRLRYESRGVREEVTTPSNLDFHKFEFGAVALWRLTDAVSITTQYSKYYLAGYQVDSSLHRPLAEPSLDAYNHPSPTGSYSGTADYLLFNLGFDM